VLRDHPGERRVLLQPPQRVLVPAVTVRHVHAETVPGGDELRCSLLAHAKQHLQLVRIPIEPRDPRERALEEPLVVRRDRDVRTALEQAAWIRTKLSRIS
jgi:hypothetical protein